MVETHMKEIIWCTKHTCTEVEGMALAED